MSEDAVVMDAFVVDRTNSEPGYTLVCPKFYGHPPNDVLDEDGIVEGLHRDVTFVCSL